MPIFTIDGNIGCGKSTVLEYLHTHYLLPIDLEPVKKWQPYLNDMYYNNKGACEFQVRVWLDRCWIQPKQDTTLLMERSPYFQKNVFIPINKDNNRLSTREVEMLNEMYDKSTTIWNPFGYIYLRSSPEKCIERINKRARESEEAIDHLYIQQLHKLHEKSYFWAAANNYPMICVDVENKTVPEIAKEIIQILENMGVIFLNGIYSSFQLNNKNSANDYNEYKRIYKQYDYGYGTANVLKTLHTHNKTIAAQLRDSSKAAHYRRKKLLNQSQETEDLKQNEYIQYPQYPQYAQYKIYKKPECIPSISSLIDTSTDSLNDAVNVTINIKESNKKTRQYEYQEAFTDDSSESSNQ
jgi:deoxyadenosine/deoxycytidine kinase